MNTANVDLAQTLVPLALAAVALVLLLGLWNMKRGGKPSLSHELMPSRVMLHFIAIIIILANLWLIGL